jgi:hypothetical protein
MIGDHIGRSEHHQHVSSPAQANLLNKTAAAAEEFKRLLLAEQEWQEERSQYQQDIAKAIQVCEHIIWMNGLFFMFVKMIELM